MIYLVTALRAEAKPLLEQWRLKRDRGFSGRLYRNDDLLLLVCGMGMDNARRALEALLAYREPEEGDLFINFGLCAAPKEYAIGTPLLCSALLCRNIKAELDTSFNRLLETATLETVEEECSEERGHAVDMEGYVLYSVLPECFKPGKRAFLKVVSDHFEPEGLDRDGAVESLRANVPCLLTLMEEMGEKSDG